tara:strand:+ start:5779 stop:6213 length:435 start_codon:yes stop_codon:yes gene_type:complete
MNVLEFEKLFQKTHQILFFGANGDVNEPMVISALFKNKTEAYEAYNAYEFLVEKLTKDEIRLVVRITNNQIVSLSFIDLTNSNVYNIDNILYNELGLNNFRNELKTNKSQSFCFSIMELSESLPYLVLKPGAFPLTIKELIFSK